jgi:hypothetical protein
MYNSVYRILLPGAFALFVYQQQFRRIFFRQELAALLAVFCFFCFPFTETNIWQCFADKFLCIFYRSILSQVNLLWHLAALHLQTMLSIFLCECHALSFGFFSPLSFWLEELQ